MATLALHLPFHRQHRSRAWLSMSCPSARISLVLADPAQPERLVIHLGVGSATVVRLDAKGVTTVAVVSRDLTCYLPRDLSRETFAEISAVVSSGTTVRLTREWAEGRGTPSEERDLVREIVELPSGRRVSLQPGPAHPTLHSGSTGSPT
jgi:hypothetical protein